MAMMLTVALSASAMSYEQARERALFLTDKMAYELNLNDEQYEAAYEVNLDYLMSINTYDDLYGTYWTRRNLDLSYILFDWQYNAFCSAAYFYRPLVWTNGVWRFSVYARYPHRTYFYFGRPGFYATYCGGHSWRMNGGRSWYHGRTFGHRPGGPNYGMRDRFDRGDFRGHRGHDGGFDRNDRGPGRNDNWNRNDRNDRGNRHDDYASRPGRNDNWGSNRGQGNQGGYRGGGRSDYQPGGNGNGQSNKPTLRPNTNMDRSRTMFRSVRNKSFDNVKMMDSREMRESSSRTTVNRTAPSYKGSSSSFSSSSRPSSSFTPRNDSQSRSSFSSGSSSRRSGGFSGGGRSGGGGHFGGRR